jgi:hypothetical protein
MRRGANFDAGLMQVNSANFVAVGVTPETVFDPCTNIKAGAQILTENYIRAKNAGHATPLRVALSEYNTGSQSRGLTNGYVNRVYAAAGLQPSSPPPYRRDQSPLATVQALIARVFDARITDAARSMNAAYGAANSYHKKFRAIDFVPRAGLYSVTREEITAVVEQAGFEVIELFGPGDPGHDDHWHLAFAPLDETRRAPTVLAVSRPVEIEADQSEPPPAWDVFATAAWQRQRPALALSSTGRDQ